MSRTVVTDAFQQLYAEGWLEGRHGSGTYVADLSGIAGDRWQSTSEVLKCLNGRTVASG